MKDQWNEKKTQCAMFILASFCQYQWKLKVELNSFKRHTGVL